jgi:hypothetical protein
VRTKTQLVALLTILIAVSIAACGTSGNGQPKESGSGASGQGGAAETGGTGGQNASPGTGGQDAAESDHSENDAGNPDLDVDGSLDSDVQAEDGGTECGDGGLDDGPTNPTCKDNYSPCATDWWKYDDTTCDICDMGQPGCTTGYTCWQVGDQRCYRTCKTNADCVDPCYPQCSSFKLTNSGSYAQCSPGPTVCRRVNAPFCECCAH